MNRDEALQQSADALQELASALKAGKSSALLRYLDTISKFHNYSFGNCMLICIQCPNATLVAGFQRWKKLKRWVKKGEAGIAILAPLLMRKSELDEDSTGNTDGEATVLRAIRGFRAVHVFDVSQTEGEPLAEIGAITGDPGERIARIEEFIRSKGIELAYTEALGGALGMSEGGKITILSTLTLAQTFSTLVHELAHELLHRGDRRKETTKVFRETEAEAVSYVVSKAVGLELSTQAVDYIQLWNGDETILMQSLELVRDAASQILTALEAASHQETVSHTEMEVAHVA